MSARPRTAPSVADVPTAGEESYFSVFANGEAFGLSVLHAQTIFRITSVTPIPLGPSRHHRPCQLARPHRHRCQPAPPPRHSVRRG